MYFLLLLLFSSPSRAEDIVAGFKVVVNARVSEADTKRARDHLASQLETVKKVAPFLYWSMREKVVFWVTDSKSQTAAATYHPSKNWLSQNGFDPAMAKGIEILNIKNFLDWAREGDQPMMILHELAHSYHDQILKFDYEPILNAFKSAVSGGKYQEVEYRTKGSPKRRAFALNDEKEYFAELSEAYFGRNDFFPFDRKDLKLFDPEGFRMIEKAFEL